MKQTVNEHEFCEAFRRIRPENFSYDGLKALYESLEEFEEGTGEEVELDVIAICCEFSEYESLKACADEYGIAYEDEDEIREQLENNTMVIDVPGGGVIIQAY